MNLETKEILIDILSLIRGVAYDQATREFSGKDWFEEIDKKLDELRNKIEDIK